METEGIQKGFPKEEPQHNEPIKDMDLESVKAKEETAGETNATQISPANEKEKGMCSVFPQPPLLFPDQNIDSHHVNSSLSPKHKKDTIENIDASMGGNDIDSISAAMPSLDLNCEDVWPPLIPSIPHIPCPYNLRYLGGKSGSSGSVGGLGEMGPQGLSKNKRGRKSNLSKAKLKAKLDVANGKQHSITGVLRAVQTPENVIK